MICPHEYAAMHPWENVDERDEQDTYLDLVEITKGWPNDE